MTHHPLPLSGFKVYGSLFRVDARYELLLPLGKGSYGIVWYAGHRFLCWDGLA